MALLHDPLSSWNHKTVMFIHGIGNQPVTYSEPLYQLLRGQDPATADATCWHEVTYNEVNDALESKVVELQKCIPPPGAAPSTSDLAATFLVDLIDYLSTVDLNNWINNYVLKALLDAIQEGTTKDVMPADHQLFLISHSLGTVVSYEVLHQIIDNPQVPGLSSNVRIKAWLTMGCPLAFIKQNQDKIPSLNTNFFLRKNPIGRPLMPNPFTGTQDSNVIDWYNYRQKFDPVASLTPLDQASSNNSLSKETSVFDVFNTGVNPHDFANYITQYKAEIMSLLRA